jgi:cytosine/adenosine deaminase-related metal-dependent hydrolase
MNLVLRNGRVHGRDRTQPCDVGIAGGHVARVAEAGTLSAQRVVDLAGRVVLPGLVNAHDHLEFSTFPALGRPPYRSLYEWASDVKAGEGDPRVREALDVPLVERLLLGGLRNLVSGATAVAHHGAFHRSLARPDFPVRVLARYGFAHSPGLTPQLRRTYRTTDRRIPWMIHAAEGVDARCRGELAALYEQNLVRQNTVLVHGIGLGPEDGPGLAAARACLVWCPESNRRLYGATAPVAALRAAGVRVGLGSDSPASGVRDALSNLAAARREGVCDDAGLLTLATRESGEVARLAVGGCEEGGAADLLVAEDLEALFSGERGAVALVLVAGEARYGRPELMDAAGARSETLRVDGAERRLAARTAQRARGTIARHAFRDVAWLAGLAWQ